MSTNRYDFSFPQGDSVPRQFQVSDPNGLPIDFTGFTVEFQMRQTSQSPDALVTCDNAANGGIVFQNGDPTTGVFSFNLTPAQTALPLGTYVWALRVYGDTTFSWTMAWGYFTVLPETAQ